jgi:hypothetical protein
VITNLHHGIINLSKYFGFGENKEAPIKKSVQRV